jgi:ubiquinone/menaquinone biosynthesis C-methylase UbiE
MHEPTTERDYFHGFSPAEQDRLIRQAEYWRESLVPLGLSYRAGEHVLEIGCAAGATLAVLAERFPGISVAGIDLEPRQVDFARRHLAALVHADADLRHGNGANLPWSTDEFDHVYIMWLIEHLADSMPLLREARRVLRPGGSICITETDYTTFKVWPPSPDWDHLEQAQFEFFRRHGNPVAGRQLGFLLAAAGFTGISSGPVGFHFFSGHDPAALRGHADYVAEFLEPGIDKLAARGYDADRLRRALAHLRSLAARRDAAMTQIVYRAHARRPIG